MCLQYISGLQDFECLPLQKLPACLQVHISHKLKCDADPDQDPAS